MILYFCKDNFFHITSSFTSTSNSGSLQPDREDELMRIESLGGRVINWQGCRISGVLAVSRSIGFFSYPDPLLICFVTKSISI